MKDSGQTIGNFVILLLYISLSVIFWTKQKRYFSVILLFKYFSSTFLAFNYYPTYRIFVISIYMITWGLRQIPTDQTVGQVFEYTIFLFLVQLNGNKKVWERVNSYSIIDFGFGKSLSVRLYRHGNVYEVFFFETDVYEVLRCLSIDPTHYSSYI